ncbi:L-rhamnose mutarotase [Arenibacter sp. ARW7G5Y1]|uniref:L-rhamnose mutarotase n=1 Tax=Arenibacter sp. ARW7G5Y1 TaxID=2135619 RepID=UPI001C645F96|nr:L-rhamnose mutarotase [Arenibacter sp. ARW7G5Y1]
MKKHIVKIKLLLSAYLIIWSMSLFGAHEKNKPSQIYLQNTVGSIFKDQNIINNIQKNAAKFSAIELMGRSFDIEKIQFIINKTGTNKVEVYKWKKHWVIYGQISNVEDLKAQLFQAYPKARLKVYETPFYSFMKSKNCPDTVLATEWEHILLTAQLVQDPILQEEYMKYHSTQFEKWPEVANGFCNADFQQLLVFRNGKQLLLAISIPKGKNLKELNPKTSENNPRMDEWNALMAKYQTGIKGTKRNETWVFFNKITEKQEERL